jgi:hypothetical protein
MKTKSTTITYSSSKHTSRGDGSADSCIAQRRAGRGGRGEHGEEESDSNLRGADAVRFGRDDVLRDHLGRARAETTAGIAVRQLVEDLHEPSQRFGIWFKAF